MKELLYNTHDLALVITIFQCLVFSFFLITLREGKQQANVLLALFLLSQAALSLDNLINFGEAFQYVALDISTNLYYSFGLAYWLEAPLLLIYVRALIYKEHKISAYEWSFFIPFLLFTAYFAESWWLIDADVRLAAMQTDMVTDTPLLDRVLHVLREVFRVACGVLCLVEIRNYQARIKQQVAETISVDLTWLKMLVIGFTIVRINSVLIALTLWLGNGINLNYEVLGLVSNYAVMLMVSVFIFYSMGYSTVFRGIDKELPATQESATTLEFDPQKVEKVEHYMQTAKPYFNHFLTLESLANQVDMQPRALSNMINQHFQKNFFEFINYYRIEESKRLLTSPENNEITILQIMDMAGFNSKATFNTCFKKLVGQTPSEFRKAKN
ncbi:MAG: helix-turn-helix domain-containing protein [Alteromonadaceae bacterium]|nr:helix-turn-helix domain-containing protein [Alteromonadaceae bacterium]